MGACPRHEGEHIITVGAAASPGVLLLVPRDGVAEERGHHGVPVASRLVRGGSRVIRGEVWYLGEEAFFCGRWYSYSYIDTWYISSRYFLYTLADNIVSVRLSHQSRKAPYVTVQSGIA